MTNAEFYKGLEEIANADSITFTVTLHSDGTARATMDGNDCGGNITMWCQNHGKWLRMEFGSDPESKDAFTRTVAQTGSERPAS